MIQALCNLLSSLGTASAPALVILDDFQWACEQTITMLRRWQTEHSQRARHIQIVVSFRSEEVASNHAIRQLIPPQQIQLTPLRPSDVRMIAESMTGSLPDRVLDLVEHAAQGSPFMTVAVLRGLVESEAIRNVDFEVDHRRKVIR